ncbi:MAG: imidazole glycerol phosphate synthase subunit HisH [Nitrospirae bacterium]|nr:imidazole glycerol phosphate synthase subunit HisH [Nitrospirota bacterium]
MENRTVTIVDYGIGNLFSVERALNHIGCKTVITSNADDVLKAERLILPGVGAFGEGMSNLKQAGIDESIKAFVALNRPLLGICLGMQLLMQESEEHGTHHGLGVFSGRVIRFHEQVSVGRRYKIPFIGWNELNRHCDSKWSGTIMDSISQYDAVYFVHSYIVIPTNAIDILANTTYGKITYCSVIYRDNIYGCQFHPEKSGEVGLKILSNFVNLGVL